MCAGIMLVTVNREEEFRNCSAMAFARSLFHAGEGKALFHREFAFAAAVSSYYSVFHLGGALILAYCSHPACNGDPHSRMRKKLEDWSQKGAFTSFNGGNYHADPARKSSTGNLCQA